MLVEFEEAFKKVREYLLTEGRERKASVSKNPKGEMSKVFDLEAEKIVIDQFKKAHLDGRMQSVLLLTEESGKITIGDSPKYIIVLDPVDGSENFKRNIESVGFSIAAIPYAKELSPKNAEYAFIGSVFSGDIWKARKGEGVWYNKNKAVSSKVRELKKACVDIDLNDNLFNALRYKKNIGRVINIMKTTVFIRRIGSCALELAKVASGDLDAHIDVQGGITPENFMAGYLIVKEAGGIITDAHGNDFGKMESITERYNIIAAGNKELHREILDAIDWNA